MTNSQIGGVMVRVKVSRVTDGPGPSDTIVAITRKEGGQEELIIDKRLIRDDSIEVAKLGSTQSSVLVELPNESASGTWRMWVPSDILK
jgi:hypothetical protein